MSYNTELGLIKLFDKHFSMEKLLAKLEEEINNMFQKEGTGHDIYHLKRVMSLALTIQKKEGGDRLIIAVSALLHDIHRIIQKETGKYCTPKDSLPKVKEILDKTELTQTQKEKILHCIEFHEEYNFGKETKVVTDIETLILQDADNIDAIGAIGAARCLYYCASYNIPIWDPKIPIETENYDSTKHDPTVIHHFYHKLLNLKDNMNTKTGKKIAQKRHEFMELFLKEFFEEWDGKK